MMGIFGGTQRFNPDPDPPKNGGFFSCPSIGYRVVESLVSEALAPLSALEHTLGPARVFLTFLRMARVRAAATGEDDALTAWRNEAACRAHPLAPDGYGTYRRHGRHHGFFLEFDRATTGRADYLKKFAAYHDHRENGGHRAQSDGFPVVLLVTTGDTDAENLIASYARLADVRRRSPLPLLLTTAWRYLAREGERPPPEGIPGPIWRSAARATRQQWPEAHASAFWYRNGQARRCTRGASSSLFLQERAAMLRLPGMV